MIAKGVASAVVTLIHRDSTSIVLGSYTDDRDINTC